MNLTLKPVRHADPAGYWSPGLDSGNFLNEMVGRFSGTCDY